MLFIRVFFRDVSFSVSESLFGTVRRSKNLRMSGTLVRLLGRFLLVPAFL